MTVDELDAAYERLHRTGPEFDGWLSNHGPMAAEALAQHGHQDALGSWLDRYALRLEAAPTPQRKVTDWREALGDARRLGDWLAFFAYEVTEAPWEEVLNRWWPRLLPGIAAGATHGVIRVGHAVRVLRKGGTSAPRVDELGQGLAYWASRWAAIPGATAPAGVQSVARSLARVPRVDQQTGSVPDRLAQLAHSVPWVAAQQCAAPGDDPGLFLRDVVTAALARYATHAHGNPVMLVHAATAPNAVLRALPALAPDLHVASANAAWSAAAAIFAAYAPAEPGPAAAAAAADPATAFAHAAVHGDEHVIKLADTAVDAYGWSGDARSLAAVARATSLIPSG